MINDKALKILIADDEEGIREILSDMIEISGHQVTMVENGKIALETYLEKPDNFDIIISDGKMPIMDGFELVQRIRANKEIKQPKIVILSGNDRSTVMHEKETCSDSKIDGYLVKPFSIDELSSLINRFTN